MPFLVCSSLGLLAAGAMPIEPTDTEKKAGSIGEHAVFKDKKGNSVRWHMTLNAYFAYTMAATQVRPELPWLAPGGAPMQRRALVRRPRFD